MAPHIPDTYLWLGLGAFLYLAVKGVAHGLQAVYDLTEVEQAETTPPNGLEQGTEDGEPLASLRILATQHANLEVRKAATSIITARALQHPPVLRRILADARRPAGSRAQRDAHHALALLRAVNGVDIEDLDLDEPPRHDDRDRSAPPPHHHDHGRSGASRHHHQRHQQHSSRRRGRATSPDAASQNAVVGMGEVRMGDGEDTAAEVGFSTGGSTLQEAIDAVIGGEEAPRRRQQQQRQVNERALRRLEQEHEQWDRERELAATPHDERRLERPATASTGTTATAAAPSATTTTTTTTTTADAANATAPTDPPPPISVAERDGTATVVLGSRPSASEYRRRREQSRAAFRALRPRSTESEAEVARRRQRREAVVINEGDRPISQEDIIQRPMGNGGV
ncbi:uncharacterized protein K452DRAFT_283099 [Aplosporella prunicola CBS 121167]|uniref:Uncharacterized protein n=1 Tax=Aplosporella prunicola CBS 121167 TaxID=1176127 RepID=A0A6A6BSX6_9PEZI|nr:uncharacterized protein K452DRAFT_283099 [Aplosporella prunicola CBS 121167]KAF2146898.1 hypothetical protein K452DRAFT_283099 [Aplosporella prunicola CBS 121167]